MTDSNSAERGWTYFLLLACTFFLLIFKLVSMECIFRWDAWNQFWPWFHYLADSLGQGRFPYWTPLPSCGFPFFAEPQTGLSYPVLVFAGRVFGGGYEVFQWYWILHWFFGVAGFFVLGRRLGLSPAGALAGSLLFGFSGFFIGNAQHTNNIVAMSYFPWVLFLVDRAYGESLAFSLPTGVLFGLAGLGGNPTMVVYAGLMLVVWCLLKYGVTTRNAAVLGIIFIVTAVVVSPAYISFLIEFSDYTERTGFLSVAQACGSGRLTLDTLISLLSPGLTVSYPQRFWNSEASMINLYMGVWGLVSLAVALSSQEYRGRWRWLLVFMAVGLLLSLGTVGGLRVIGYYLLPPLRMVRHSALFRAYFIMGGALLAGSVLDRLVLGSDEERERITSACLKVGCAATAVALAALGWAWGMPEFSARLLHGGTMLVPNSFAAALYSVLPSILLWGLFCLLILLFRKKVLTRWFVPILLVFVAADCATHVATNSATLCWDGRAVQLAQKLETLGERAKQGTLDSRPRIIKPAEMNLWAFDGYFYIRNYLAARSRDFEFLVGGTMSPVKDTRFLAVLEKSPLFWLVPSVIPADPKDKTGLYILQSRGPEDPVPVFVHCDSVEHGGDIRDAVVPGSFGKVTIVRYDPEKVILDVDAPRDCWLFAARRHAAGWKAYVDGRPTRLCKADYCFSALRVTKGRSRVTLAYEPSYFRPLLLISWGLCFIGLVGVGVAAFFTRARRRDEEGRTREGARCENDE